MKYTISNNRLKIILDELGEDYKDALIKRVLDDTNQYDVERIKISDIVYFDMLTKLKLENGKEQKQHERFARSMNAFGVIYIILGVLLAIYITIKNGIITDVYLLTSFITMFMGLALILASVFYKNKHVIRIENYTVPKSSNINYEIINKWKKVEALLYDLAPEKQSYSRSELIALLKDTGILTTPDAESLKKLSYYRNQLVHAQEEKVNIPEEEARKVLSEIDKIIAKMMHVL